VMAAMAAKLRARGVLESREEWMLREIKAQGSRTAAAIPAVCCKRLAR